MSVGPPLQPFSKTVDSELLLLGSFALLLAGAEVFTNGVEWVGHEFGVSESATGSVLAAVGTALPETMIPVIAIARARFGSGSQAAADEVGVGAILGAPFMLATVAMFLVGASVFYSRGRRSHGGEFHFDAESTRRDLTLFLVGYVLAFGAALVHSALLAHVVAAVLLCLYVVYVYLSLRSGDLIEGEELEDLLLGAAVEKGESPVRAVGMDADYSSSPTTWLILLQTLVALAFIVGGAQLFVSEVEFVSENLLHVPGAVVALLLAPLGDRTPREVQQRPLDIAGQGHARHREHHRRDGVSGHDTRDARHRLHLVEPLPPVGHDRLPQRVLRGARGRQRPFLYLRARRSDDENMRPAPFLIGGLLYLVFIAVLAYHVVVLHLASAAP